MAEPKIFTKNYVSAACLITASHGDAAKVYLYDRDNDAKWLSSGANDDATQISIEIEFMEGNTAVDRRIDSLFLINHNLKNWDAEYWDGDSWEPLTSENADDEDFTFKSFGAVTTAKIRILCDETQVADAEKFIGELIACALQMAIPNDLKSNDVRYREKGREVVMGDGSIHKMVTRWTQNRISKYECNAVVQLLNKSGQTPETDRLTLKAICDTRQPFLWQPESTFRPDEIFLVRWASPWAEKYVSTYKSAGIEIPMNLREV